MANTTLTAIIDRVQAVVEAAPLSLTPTEEPFTFEVEPNRKLQAGTYWVQDVGVSESTLTGGDQEVRIDLLTVWLAQPTKFDGQAAVESIEATMITLERRVLADGPAQSYHAIMTGREVAKVDGVDVMLGAMTFSFDYDFTTSTS